MDRETPEWLSKGESITLVLAQAAQIAALTERIAALEAKLGLPPSTTVAIFLRASHLIRHGEAARVGGID